MIATLLLATVTAEAQLLPKNTTQEKTEKDKPSDPLGRDTPRGTVAGFLSAVSDNDFEKAAQYLDTRSISRRSRKTADLAKDFGTLLDKGGRINPPAMLNGDTSGKQNDDLPDDTDKIGTIHSGNKDVDVLLQRIADETNQQIWVFSTQTVSQIAVLQKNIEDPLINSFLPSTLIEDKWYGAPIGHWLAVIIIFILSYGITWIVMRGIIRAMHHLFLKNKTGKNVVDAFIAPISLYLAVWVFGLSCSYAGITILLRQYFGQLNVIIAWVALALLLWRLIDVFASMIQKRLSRNGRFKSFSSIIFFTRRITKFFFVVLTLILILDNLGVDVTAGLAALGIGGIALALGAQKTLENFIGSVAIILDHPIHIGDYCKIGDNTVGTIEDIGMRSTRVRTNDRTVITIPNGTLSTQQIENYARRDRILMTNKLRIRYDARPAQVKDLVNRINEIFAATPQIIQDPLAARFTGFIPEAMIIEIFVYVATADFNEFLRVQQDVMLQIMDAVEASGCSFALPIQTFLPKQAQA
ncbi:MAG: mechanosensitive ion channel protein MscS [Micavibrio sp.]|nr:mechanosensitive ion channel protein MscS [Micavibrio sp.]